MSDCREMLFKEKSCSNMPFYLQGIPMYKISTDGTTIFSYLETTKEGISEYVENGEISTATLEDYKRYKGLIDSKWVWIPRVLSKGRIVPVKKHASDEGPIIFKCKVKEDAVVTIKY